MGVIPDDTSREPTKDQRTANEGPQPELLGSLDATPEEHHVLVVSSDADARFLATLVLSRDLQVEVCQAETALDGLQWLETQHFWFVVLDLGLPSISGLHMLEIIRHAPDTATVPVVALVTTADDATTRRAIELGISGIISTPLDLAQLEPRLIECSRRLSSPPPALRPPRDGDSSHDGRPLLVVDGDPRFTQVAKIALGGHRRVLTAATGARALTLAREHQPGVALIGHHLGILRADMLVAEIRATPILGSCRLIAVAPKNRIDPALSTAAYDGVIARTFTPDLFREQVDHLFKPLGSVTGLFGAFPRLRTVVVSAIEQICEMMLHIEVAELTSRLPGSGDSIEASQDVSGLNRDVRLRFALRAGVESARLIGARLRGGAPGTIDEAGAALGELANIVTGRLRGAMNERGISVACTLPAITVRASAMPVEAGAEEELRLFFGSDPQTVVLQAGLTGPASVGRIE